MTWKNSDAIAECLDHGIIFHSHIPKTAGTSILRGFQETLDPDHFIHWNPSNPYNMDKCIRELQIVLEENRDLKVITGHFMYGVHAALRGRPYKYFTMLRDPVARVFSHYKHAIQNNLHTMEDQKSRAFIDLEIQETIKQPDISFFYNNLQARFISGLTDATFGGRSDAELLALCARNIRNDYCFVGSQASIATAVADLSELLDLEDLREWTENSRGRIDPRTLFTAEQIADILDQNSVDVSLVKTFCPESDAPAEAKAPDDTVLSEVMLNTYKTATKLLLRRVRQLQG